MPQSRRTGSGARNARSVPGGTTTRPSGFLRSDAIFAMSLAVATPTEAVSFVSSRIRALIFRAMVSPSPNRRTLAVTSRKASSTEIGSTRSVNASKTTRICFETSLYFAMSGAMKTPCGHSRQAVEIGMALATPNLRAA